MAVIRIQPNSFFRRTVRRIFEEAITEQRFLDLIDDLSEKRQGLYYTDERETLHSVVDFTIREGGLKLPANLNSAPDLLYVVSVDYLLLGLLDHLLPSLFDGKECIVWDLLNKNGGSLIMDAEDRFVFSIVRKYWPEIKKAVAHNPFHVISARKAIAILHNMPQRTPGIGLRAWGTGANAEVNVHISIQEDTTTWSAVFDRIVTRGISDIIEAVNKKRVKEVYDPEI